jgi:hypothetical protein
MKHKAPSKPVTQSNERAYRFGRLAFAEGKERDENPYKGVRLQHLEARWNKGWDIASRGISPGMERCLSQEALALLELSKRNAPHDDGRLGR